VQVNSNVIGVMSSPDTILAAMSVEAGSLMVALVRFAALCRA
jgi:hypothetical protein